METVSSTVNRMKEYTITKKQRINNGDGFMNIITVNLLFKGNTTKTANEIQNFMIDAKEWCTDKNFKIEPVIAPILGIGDYDLITGVSDGTFHHGFSITCRQYECTYIGELTPPHNEGTPSFDAWYSYTIGVENAWHDSVLTFIAKTMKYFNVPEATVYIIDTDQTQAINLRV